MRVCEKRLFRKTGGKRKGIETISFRKLVFFEGLTIVVQSHGRIREGVTLGHDRVTSSGPPNP